MSRVLVKQFEVPTQSASGLFLPKSASKDDLRQVMHLWQLVDISGNF